jgi:hypothetical protein
VLQRRVRPQTELFPSGPGEREPYVVTWGLFTVANGYGGVFTRGVTAESGTQVINIFGGAAAGCVLSTEPGEP